MVKPQHILLLLLLLLFWLDQVEALGFGLEGWEFGACGFADFFLRGVGGGSILNEGVLFE